MVLIFLRNATAIFQKVSSYIYTGLLYIAILSSIFPIMAGIRGWKIIGKDLKTLFFLLLIGFLIDFVTVWKRYDVYLHEISYTYLLLELLFVMYIVMLWQESSLVKRLLQMIVVLFVLFWIFARFTTGHFTQLYSIVGSVSKIILY